MLFVKGVGITLAFALLAQNHAPVHAEDELPLEEAGATPEIATDAVPVEGASETTEAAPIEGELVPTEINPDELPPIDARTYGVKVLARSGSGKVYLMDDMAHSRPDIGRILLIKKEKEFVMGMRVLKRYDEKFQFAVKRVRIYKMGSLLYVSDKFRAVEKLGAISAVPNTAQDNLDLQELENQNIPAQPQEEATAPVEESAPIPEAGAEEALTDGATAETTLPEETTIEEAQTDSGELPVEGAEAPAETAEGEALPVEGAESAAFDPELDTGSSPAPLPVEGADPEGQLDSAASTARLDLDSMQITADEFTKLDIYKNWLSLEMNAVSIRLNDGSIGFNPGVGVRYGYTFKELAFFKNAGIQDSFTAELGFHFFKLLSYAEADDAYTMMPVTGTVRYNINIGQDLSVFGYAGLLQGLVISGSNTNEVALQQLQSLFISFGVGLMINMGPNWTARADIGIDRAGVGLVLKF